MNTSQTDPNQIPAANQPSQSKEKQLTVSHDHRVYSIITENDLPEGQIIKHALHVIKHVIKDALQAFGYDPLRVPEYIKLRLERIIDAELKMPDGKIEKVTYKILDITQSVNRNDLTELGERTLTFAEEAIINVLDVNSNTPLLLEKIKTKSEEANTVRPFIDNELEDETPSNE